MEPHNQHQLQEAIISFLKEHPGRHSVIDVHFGISDYFADHCYKNETARTLWKLNGDGIVKYQGGFFIPPTNDLTTMTNEDQPMSIYQSLDFPSYGLVHRFMHESGFAVPDPDVEPAFPRSDFMKLASRLIMYGADQELDAICELVGQQQQPEGDRYFDGITVKSLKLARRPKPPSEKEQALEALERIDGYAVSQMRAYTIHDDLIEDVAIIRRALEATPEVRQ
jgi:hypothetical protein